MEELLAVLVGTGAVVFSPLLIPGLRPVAKSAIKGGMAVADAARGAAVATTEGCRDVVTKANEVLKPGRRAAAPEASVEEAASSEAAPPQEAVNSTNEADRQTAAPHAIDLAPVVTAITKAGQSLGDAATGILAQAGKQWSTLIADARAERKAGETAAATEAVQDQVMKSQAAAPRASGPVMVPASTAAGDNLEQIRGIGPKVAALLRDAGITTFDQLAAIDVEQLRVILTNAGARYRVTDPTPWPAEARQLLATRGD